MSMNGYSMKMAMMLDAVLPAMNDERDGCKKGQSPIDRLPHTKRPFNSGVFISSAQKTIKKKKRNNMEYNRSYRCG